MQQQRLRRRCPGLHALPGCRNAVRCQVMMPPGCGLLICGAGDLWLLARQGAMRCLSICAEHRAAEFGHMHRCEEARLCSPF